MRKTVGLTLVELMITIAIIGIMFAVGSSLLGGYVQQKEAARVADELTQSLKFARDSAQTFSSPVSVDTIGSGWNTGWVITKDVDNSILKMIGDVSSPISPSLSITGPAGLTFNPRGQVGANFTISIKRSGCNLASDIILINVVGQIQVLEDQGC